MTGRTGDVAVIVVVLSDEAGSACSNDNANCWRDISPRAVARRASSDSADPATFSCSAPAARAWSRWRASARSSSPVTATVPVKDTWSVCTATCRVSGTSGDGFSGSSRSSPSTLILASRTRWSSWVSDTRPVTAAT